MTIPAPLTFPAWLKWRSRNLSPVAQRQTASMLGRRTEQASYGDGWWRFDGVSVPLSVDQAVELQVLLAKLQASGQTIRVTDPFRPRPAAYAGAALSGTKAGGGAFNGTGPVDSLTATTATISGLPANFEFTAGDLIEIRNSATETSLHRIRADVTGNGSGVATVALLPAINRDVFDGDSTYILEKPAAIMLVEGNPAISSGVTANDRVLEISCVEAFF